MTPGSRLRATFVLVTATVVTCSVVAIALGESPGRPLLVTVDDLPLNPSLFTFTSGYGAVQASVVPSSKSSAKISYQRSMSVLLAGSSSVTPAGVVTVAVLLTS